MKPSLPYIIFEITSRCNLDCRYCYNPWKRPCRTEHKYFNSYKKSIKTLKRLFKVADVENVTFTGGEPFMSERFAETVLFCRLKKKSAGIITNGNYAGEEMYKTMIKLGVNIFEIPIHSHISEEHDYMTQVKGSWEKAVNSAKTIKELGGYVVPVIVITKANYKNLDKTLIFIKELGFKDIMLNRFNIGGKGISEKNNLLISHEELRNVFSVLNKTAGEHELSVTSNVCTPFCLLNPADYPNIPIASCSSVTTNMPLTIDIEGNMRICNHSPVTAGNIFYDNIEDILNSDYTKKWTTTIPLLCKDCDKFKDCMGGCRAASEQLGLSLEYADPVLQQ